LNVDRQDAKNGDDRSAYYQQIARRFFQHRGAPFSLSPRDLVLIARWEDMRIPLGVVLEGIDKAFDLKRREPSPSKVRSLSFCDAQVLKLFAQVRDAGVGREKRGRPMNGKKKDPALIIRGFLESLPAELEPLRKPFLQALVLYESRSGSEEEWERLEEEAEDLIIASAGKEDRETVKKRVSAEFKAKSKEEFERIFKIKLAKFLREKYRIPYLSPFYY